MLTIKTGKKNKQSNAPLQLDKKSTVALKLNKVNFRYQQSEDLALKNISFEINQGEYITIIGHNGSGKSTLSKLIMGVLNFQEGHVQIFGHEANRKNYSRLRKFLAIVFQNPDNQFIGSTVQDDIAFGLQNRQVPTAEMQTIVKQAAKRVGMQDFLDAEPLMLSGGQKQRVAIASALALKPEIIIFDEATSMLDPAGTQDIKNIILELRSQRKQTIISVTHDMDEILNADRVLVLNKGQIVKFAPPLEIIADTAMLRSIQLEVPFITEVAETLIALNLPIRRSVSQADLVTDIKALCQNSKI